MPRSRSRPPNRAPRSDNRPIPKETLRQRAWHWLMSPPRRSAPAWVHSVLSFLEHSFVILPAGIIGGIVAVIFPPLFTVLGICFVLGLHRSRAVSGRSRLLQGCVYSVLIAASYFGLLRLNAVIQKQLADNNTAFAKLVASFSGKAQATAIPSPQPLPVTTEIPPPQSSPNPKEISQPSSKYE